MFENLTNCDCHNFKLHECPKNKEFIKFLTRPKRECKKHKVALVPMYSYFPKKRKHWECRDCIKEWIRLELESQARTKPVKKDK